MEGFQTVEVGADRGEGVFVAAGKKFDVLESSQMRVAGPGGSGPHQYERQTFVSAHASAVGAMRRFR